MFRKTDFVVRLGNVSEVKFRDIYTKAFEDTKDYIMKAESKKLTKTDA